MQPDLTWTRPLVLDQSDLLGVWPQVVQTWVSRVSQVPEAACATFDLIPIGTEYEAVAVAA